MSKFGRETNKTLRLLFYAFGRTPWQAIQSDVNRNENEREKEREEKTNTGTGSILLPNIRTSNETAGKLFF